MRFPAFVNIKRSSLMKEKKEIHGVRKTDRGETVENLEPTDVQSIRCNEGMTSSSYRLFASVELRNCRHIAVAMQLR
jgi:hypothetical protein